MFNRGNLTGSSRVPVDSTLSILGEGTHWQGEIHAGANGLRVEGVVEGTILSEGQVGASPAGVVKGTIHSKHLTVTGRVEGIFKVSGRLEIHKTGWVEGRWEERRAGAGGGSSDVCPAELGGVRGAIHSKRLTVTGRVEGIFKVSGRLEIHKTGWVEG